MIKWKAFFTILLILSIGIVAPAVTTEASQLKGQMQMDGYFDDWAQVPKTKVTYWSWNGKEFHELALAIDGDYLCFYAHMADSYHFQIPIDEYTLKIGNKERTFVIRRTINGGHIDYLNVPRFLPDGTYTKGFGVFFRDGGFQSLGDVGLCVSNHSPNDQLEFRIPITTIEQLFCLKPGTLQSGIKLELYNWNIGWEHAVLVGTSSGPVAGVAVCIATCSGALLLMKEKRKRRLK